MWLFCTRRHHHSSLVVVAAAVGAALGQTKDLLTWQLFVVGAKQGAEATHVHLIVVICKHLQRIKRFAGT